jgi:TetR/AcrR family transcriptional repressor of nem operon
MARPKEFDPQTALTAAMEKFWESGYDATSLVDLTECMGVQKASLYATYGDKRKLFITALAQYQDAHYEAAAVSLPEAPSVRTWLRESLLYWMREAATKDSARGCFCVNTAVELGPRDPEIARMLAVHSRRFEELIAVGLERAKASGEVRADLDTQTAARFMYVTVYGLSAAGKGCFSAAKLEPVVDMAMSVLDRCK